MAVKLVKGQKISLKKDDGSKLTSFCVGANWGVIEKKGFFRTKKIPVDLDLSAIICDSNKEFLDLIYFGKLNGGYGISHSGDDLVGDIDGDDGLDNEIIEVNLHKLPEEIDQIVFILNSFNRQDFATIPFASIRLYEGTPSRVNNIFATYNIAKERKFAGYVSMILGKLYKRNGEWKFAAIGEPTRDRELKDTILTVIQRYL